MEKRLCSFEGCDRTYDSKGLCITHYKQQRRGVPLAPIGSLAFYKECVLVECYRKATASGLCRGHTAQERAGEEFTRNFDQALPSADKLNHGLPHTYTKYKCRCERCKAAWNAAQAARNAARKQQDFSVGWVHGLEATYNAGCRCQECKFSQSAVVAEVNYIKRRHNKDETIELQGNVCACCFRKPEKFVLDHIHGTTHFRGYLCNSCNSGIGKLGDNVAGLERAIEYLKRSTPKELLEA